MVAILSTEEFEKKIKMGIPMNKVPHPPNLAEHYGKTFSCGCGETHILDNLDTPAFLDQGMFKISIIVKDCQFLNALKLRSLFSTEIKTLYSCKFEKDKERFGFKRDYPEFDQVIKQYI